MDIAVRFWNNETNKVDTRYLTSAFLDNATAKGLVDGFTSSIDTLGLSLKKCIHISMDGPNVNLKFLKDLKEILKEDEDEPEMFDVGTCSLHIVQGAYKTAHKVTGWQIHEFVRALYYLFKDFPSRRAEFSRLTGSKSFPLKFCQIRWVENSRVFKRAIDMLPFLKIYVAGTEKSPPHSENYKKIKACLSDPLLPAKLEFLLSVSLQLEPFLVLYQSNDPLLPFLYQDLYNLLKSIGSRFLREKAISGVKNCHELININPLDPAANKNIQNVDIGFGAKVACNKVKDIFVLRFRNDCKCFLQHIFSKLTAKCPLKYRLVKGASCLSPDVMESDVLRKSRINCALEVFVLKKQLVPSVADRIKKDYLLLCENPRVSSCLKTFDRRKHKLDKFLVDLLSNSKCENSKELLNFIQKILVMFHGNAAVERGFSINKECLVENLTGPSLISQRCVYGAVTSAGGISEVLVSKEMILAVRNASAKRQEALAERRDEKKCEENRKKRVQEEIKELKIKKQKLIEQQGEELKTLDEKIVNLKNKF